VQEDRPDPVDDHENIPPVGMPDEEPSGDDAEVPEIEGDEEKGEAVQVVAPPPGPEPFVPAGIRSRNGKGRGRTPREEAEERARADIAGYYAHCTALDEYLGMIVKAIENNGIAEDTILVFTSDHGDMLGSHGLARKQKPWDESIRIPFLLRYPARFGWVGRAVDDIFVDSHDIMPTLLGLAGAEIPSSVQGTDMSPHLVDGTRPEEPCTVLACYQPFGEWSRARSGGVFGYSGREYRGLRTPRYTYAETLAGAWLLFDNAIDPYQLENLIEHPGYRGVRADLHRLLWERLGERGDTFETGEEYIRRFGYTVDETGTIPYGP